MTLSKLWRVLGLAAVYAVVARLGLALDAVGGFATLVWPPTGLSLAAVFLGGVWLAPGVFLGALAANLWVGAPLPVALGIGIGNTLEAVAGAYALTRAGVHPELDRLRDVMSLVVLGALLSTLLSAGCGVASLSLGGVISTAALGETFRAWWLGDLIGNLVVGALCLCWARPRPSGRRQRRGREAAALSASTVLLTALVFVSAKGPLTQPFLVFPLLVWAALRFGQRGTTAVTFAVATGAIAATTLGLGPFVHPELHMGLTELQVFIGSLALGGMALAAVAEERTRAEERARETYALINAIVEGTTDAVFVKDRQGRYVLINEAGARFMGKPATEIVGHNDDAFFSPELAATLMQNDGAVMAGDEARTIEEVVDVAGARRTFLSTKAPLRDEQSRIVGLVGIARDITERKRNERLLAEAIAVRDEFLSIASHELRTPLAGLVLELGGLRRRLTPPHDPDIDKRLARTRRQSERLERLVNTLLEVSRMSNGPLQLACEDLDVVGLVREILDRFSEEADRVESRLQLDAPASLMASLDRLRFDQLVTNLLANALKYGSGKPIEVTVSADAAELRLAVRDHGIGLSPEDTNRIFERFERAVSVRHFGGLGLGLYICRQIVQAHGGEISASPASGGGSLFVVTLPLREPTVAGPHPPLGI